MLKKKKRFSKNQKKTATNPFPFHKLLPKNPTQKKNKPVPPHLTLLANASGRPFQSFRGNTEDVRSWDVLFEA